MTFQYVKPTDEEVELMNQFREKFEELYNDIQDCVPESRNRSLALTKLEESAMWLNKGIVHLQ